MASFNQSYSQFLQSSVSPGAGPGISTFMLARVVHIVQGPNLFGTTTRDPYYQNPTDLGVIAFQILNSPQDRTLDSSGNTTAKPIFAGFKQYPLQGELVYVVAGPSVGMNNSRGEREFFYFPPYNLWNSAHHNAFPDLGDVSNYVQTVNRSYQDSLGTNQPVNAATSGSPSYPLGPNFPEKSNIKTLRQFTGDVTLEGRWGNSIRLGSTTFSTVKENNWSQDSEFGNPITIIRNGQGKPADDIPWFPTVENINRDPSSIYLTQGQKIIIDDIQRSFSLASLGVKLETTQTIAVPIQQQLTSTDTTSAQQQDNFTHNITNPTATTP